MSFASTLEGVSPTDDADLLADIASRALDEGEEDQALPLLERSVEIRRVGRLWQWKALLERAIDHHEQALESFQEAERLDPDDASIAHGYARTALEAGIDARQLYDRALELAPNDGSLLIGRAAAYAAAGEGNRAVNELAQVLARAPAWIDGHEQLAQFLATEGRGDEATASLERALMLFPQEAALWEALLRIEVRRKQYESILPIIERGKAAGAQSLQFALYEGIAAAELSDDAEPAALFSPAAEATPELTIWRIRHLLRTGDIDRLMPILDDELARNPAGDAWAYASTAWRIAEDPRSDWLERQGELVRVIDLLDSLPPLDQLTETLKNLHVTKAEYLDQAVRGGTQTDGPLFSRIDPTIQAVRHAVVGAIQDYVTQLPAEDAGHPLLHHRRDRRIRFAGSWSVLLKSSGHLANHTHPQGWISSALYISLPAQSEGDAGWFRLGEPDERLGISLPPQRKIEPKPGRLVLFPSWMWHGTVPFSSGERLSLAFDVAQPR